MKYPFFLITKKLCSLILMLTISASMLSAYDFYIGGIYYAYGASDVSVTYGDQKYSGSIVIPASITVNGKNLPVVGISHNAFQDCEDLLSVSIPYSVKTIGQHSFENCSKLSSINLPTGLNSIGRWAFKNCHNLTSLFLPDGLEVIDSETFMNCESLLSIVIPNSITAINNSAFSGCSGLKSIKIGEKVNRIGDSAFSGCTGLTALVIPNNVSGSGTNAFKGCTNIETLVIEDSETVFSYGGFSDLKPINFYLGRVNGTIEAYSQNVSYSSYLPIDFSNTKVLTIGKYIETVEKRAGVALSNSTWRAQLYQGNFEVIYAMSAPSFSFNNTTKIYSQLYVPIGMKESFLANQYYKDFFSITEMDIADMWHGEVEIPDFPDPNPDPDPNYMKCDVNGDGEVNIADINRVIEAILSH